MHAPTPSQHTTPRYYAKFQTKKPSPEGRLLPALRLKCVGEPRVRLAQELKLVESPADAERVGELLRDLLARTVPRAHRRHRDDLHVQSGGDGSECYHAIEAPGHLFATGPLDLRVNQHSFVEHTPEHILPPEELKAVGAREAQFAAARLPIEFRENIPVHDLVRGPVNEAVGRVAEVEVADDHVGPFFLQGAAEVPDLANGMLRRVQANDGFFGPTAEHCGVIASAQSASKSADVRVDADHTETLLGGNTREFDIFSRVGAAIDRHDDPCRGVFHLLAQLRKERAFFLGGFDSLSLEVGHDDNQLVPTFPGFLPENIILQILIKINISICSSF